jgi:hypothetical protein
MSRSNNNAYLYIVPMNRIAPGATSPRGDLLWNVTLIILADTHIVTLLFSMINTKTIWYHEPYGLL